LDISIYFTLSDSETREAKARAAFMELMKSLYMQDTKIYLFEQQTLFATIMQFQRVMLFSPITFTALSDS
jgi:hypothetical protein